MAKEIKFVTYTPGFLVFWDQCRRKKGKQVAQRTWNKHGLELMFQKVSDKMAYDVKTEFNQRFMDKVPHPSTWLNDGCYDDPIPAPPPTGPSKREVARRELTALRHAELKEDIELVDQLVAQYTNDELVFLLTKAKAKAGIRFGQVTIESITNSLMNKSLIYHYVKSEGAT